MADRHKTGEGRGEREYPHGTGDRNAWSPTGTSRMPLHRGGTQREPVKDTPADTPDEDADSD